MITQLNRTTIAELDRLSLAQVVRAYGSPDRVDTRHHQPLSPYWQPGEGRPTVAPESPAEAQAVARCLLSRIVGPLADVARSHEIHPSPCGWCDYPLEELLKACDYANWFAQHVDVEYAVWIDEDRHEYRRSTGRTGEYDNPTWAAWFEGATPSTADAKPSDLEYWRRLRREQTEAAAGREEVAS